MGLVLHFLCNDGSPRGVTEKTIWGDDVQPGVGGAELALLTMCAELTKRGHKVVLFNDPRELHASCFEQRAIHDFRAKEKRDVLVIFRSPNNRAIPVTDYKVWWSCDQATTGSFGAFSREVDKIVTISKYHADFFNQMYGIVDTVITDLPVRMGDYVNLLHNPPKRIKNRFIFTSVPDRGLDNLRRMWQKLRQEIPDISLVITSDYRLWGGSCNNERHRMKWAMQDGVRFLGAISRKQLLEEQLQAEYMLYPGNYPELFCIAVAEAQFAGIDCITSACGALATTNMGKTIDVDASNPHNDKLFVQAVLDTLNNPERETHARMVQQYAESRFNPNRIVEYWEQNILKG